MDYTKQHGTLLSFMVRITDPDDYKIDSIRVAVDKHKYVAVLKHKRTGQTRQVPFGDKNYQHYRDKLGHYSQLNHLDEERRRRFWLRHAQNAQYKYSSAWWSAKCLW